MFANFTHQLNLPMFTHDCIHFVYNLYINESPRNGKKNKSLRNQHQNTNERGRRRWRRLGAQGPWAGGTRRRHRRRTLSFVFWWWFLKLLFFFPFRGLSFMYKLYKKCIQSCVKIGRFNWCVKLANTIN